MGSKNETEPRGVLQAAFGCSAPPETGPPHDGSMRILHTNFLRGWGGQSNRILQESLGAAARGCEVTISAPPGSELIRRASEAGLAVEESVTYRGGLRWGAVADARRLAAIVDRVRPEILHLHGGRDSWIAAGLFALRLARHRPAVLRTKHNVFPVVRHPLNLWIYRKFFRYLCANSTAVYAQLAGLGIAPERIFLVHSAVDVRGFRRDPEMRAARRTEFGFGPGDFVIAMTGRFRPEKGHDLLLGAAPAICAEVPEARFLLLGDGSGANEARERLRASGLESRFVLPGFRTDVVQCLQAADLYVQPSRSEGLGTGLIEASALGLASVATRVGGISDVVLDGRTGYLCEPESPESLAAAVVRLARARDAQTALGEAAREHAVRHFSLESLGDATVAMYRSVAAGQPAPPLPR